MKKTSKYIIITLAILLVLGGVFAILYFTNPDAGEAEESSASSAASIALFTREKADVSKVSVKNSKGEFTLVQTATTEIPEPSETSGESEAESSAVPETTYRYAFEGFEQYGLKTIDIESALRNVCAPTASKDMGEVENLADYGLDDASATSITVQFTDGAQETFLAGIEGGETYGRYILYNGRVYIGYLSEVIFADKYEYFKPFGYDASGGLNEDGSEAAVTLSNLTLTGTNYPEPITLVYDSEQGEYRMQTPISSASNITNMEALVTALKTVTAASTVVANATDADLEQYGLKTPYATAQFEINGQSHTLSVSEQKADGKRYLIADGDTSIIYTIKAEDVSAWAEADVTKLRSSYVFLPVIMTVDDFTIEAGGKTTVVDLSRTKNEEKSSDTQTTYDYSAKVNGNDIDYDTVPEFYSSMISIAVLNNEKLEYTEAPEVTLTFNYYEGGQDIVTYHRATEDRLIALLNGEYSATIRSTSIETFLASLETFAAQ